MRFHGTTEVVPFPVLIFPILLFPALLFPVLRSRNFGTFDIAEAMS
jgi:hypothetical protein